MIQQDGEEQYTATPPSGVMSYYLLGEMGRHKKNPNNKEKTSIIRENYN